MKFSRKTILLALVVVALAYYFFVPRKSASTGGPVWKVYGTMSCGWTRKQLEHMKKKGVAHEFVDCDGGACANMEAFPVVESPDGERKVGYTEM